MRFALQIAICSFIGKIPCPMKIKKQNITPMPDKHRGKDISTLGGVDMFKLQIYCNNPFSQRQYTVLYFI